jgi:hypothetical protein
MRERHEDAVLGRTALPACVRGALFAQSPSPGAPFGLKGDVLGETLQEFRARHDRTIQTLKDKIFRTPAMTLHFPQCTNEPEVMRDWRTPESLKRRWTTEETRAGVVKCITTRGSEGIGRSRAQHKLPKLSADGGSSSATTVGVR